MKKVMVILAMMVALHAAQAQQRGGRGTMERDPEARAKARVERLDEALKLTPQQKDSIHNWVLAQTKTQQNTFKDAGQNRENIRSQMQQIHQQTDSKIVSILDETQKAKYAEMQKQQKNRRPAGGVRGKSRRGDGQEVK